MKHIAIFIAPNGEEFYSAYGPMTKDRAGATQYASEEVATRGALNTLGRGGRAFWGSERLAEDAAYKRYKGWTFRTEAACPVLA